MTRSRFLLLLALLSLAVRLPMLHFLRTEYLSGGITTSLGLVARNLLEGRGLSETTGPDEILLLYDLQLDQGRLRDIAEFPDPPDQPTRPLIQRMPGYPFLLAMSFKLTGSYRYLPIQLVQILGSSLLPLLLYGAARRTFGERQGRVAGILAALNFAEIRLALVPLYDWWIIFLVGLLLWLLARSRERDYPWRSFVLMGAVLAAGTLLKSTVVVVPLFLAAAVFVMLRPWRAAPRAAALVALPLLVLFPWAARNQRVFHRFIPTNTFLWPSVWEGFGEVANPFGAVLDDRRTYLTALQENHRLVYGSPEYDDYFAEKVNSVFGSRPGFVVTLWGKRLVGGLLFPANPWGLAGIDRPEASFSTFRARTGGSPVAYLLAHPLTASLKLLQHLWDPALFFMGLLALWEMRHRWRELLPLLAFPAAFLAVTVPIHLEGRYLLPGSLVFLMLASVPLAGWLPIPSRSRGLDRQAVL